MRILIFLMAMALPALAQAEGFRIAANGCVASGQGLRIDGSGFGSTASGDIVAAGAEGDRPLQVLRWTPSRLLVKVPPRGMRPGGTYRVIWSIRGTVSQDLGSFTLCKTRQRNAERAARDAVPAPDGSPEYSVLVTAAQERAARTALEGRGAELLRRRNLPQMGRVMLFFAFPQGLTLQDARAVLGVTAPSAAVDRHNIYGFAAGPRLYAAALVGDPADKPCRLPRGVRIGLIDGPLQAGHPALAGLAIQRHSVLTPGLRHTGSAHATAIAGLIAGDGSGGFTGLAPGVQLFAAEAFAREKGGDGARLEHIAAGLDWLLGRSVQLVNMSMSGAPNAVFEALLSRARARGMIVIAASGNEGSDKPRLPAASPDTIAVTAVDAARRLYRKANRGSHIEFAAPGVDLWVITAKGGGYRSGTSYAAPVVTALLARAAARGGLSLEKARRLLRGKAIDLGPAGRDPGFGHGLVQSGGC